MDIREMVNFNLSSGNDTENLPQFEMDLDDLNVTSLNGKVRNLTGLGGKGPDLTLLLWIFTHCIHQREAVLQIRTQFLENKRIP